jgi:hypothetical protein
MSLKLQAIKTEKKRLATPRSLTRMTRNPEPANSEIDTGANNERVSELENPMHSWRPADSVAMQRRCKQQTVKLGRLGGQRLFDQSNLTHRKKRIHIVA